MNNNYNSDQPYFDPNQKKQPTERDVSYNNPLYTKQQTCPNQNMYNLDQGFNNTPYAQFNMNNQINQYNPYYNQYPQNNQYNMPNQFNQYPQNTQYAQYNNQYYQNNQYPQNTQYYQPDVNYQNQGLQPDTAFNNLNTGMQNLTIDNKYDIYSFNYGIGNSLMPTNFFDIEETPQIPKAPAFNQFFLQDDIQKINLNNNFDVLNNMKDYWGGKNDNHINIVNDTNNINSKKINIFDDKIDNTPKIEISNVFMIRRKKDKNENDEKPNPKKPDQIKPKIPSMKKLPKVPSNKNPLVINNWAIKSFVPTNNRNELDDLQDLLKKSEKYQKALMASRIGKYNDPDFKPNHEAIIGFGERRDYTESQARDFAWLRPEEFFKGTYKVYDKIEPDDIMQGGLGDCYFLAAISSIAHDPRRLERIFLTKTINKEGIYLVALCINGIWEEVVLDDYFPCQKYSKEPAFNHSSSNELWVMLLEKAWAKVHGGYLNIAAGLTREALRDLTGACAKTFFTSDQKKENVWEIMIDAFEKGFILTAGSDDINNGSDAYQSKIGIAGSHAYSLLGVYELCYEGGQYKRIYSKDRKSKKVSDFVLKLRNPWGKKEWKGDWADTSARWNSQLRIDLGIEVKDNGIFCIGFDNFLKYYSDFQVCYYHENYKYSAVKVRSQKYETVLFKFNITKNGKYYFCLNQKNRRFFKKNENYNYSSLSILIAFKQGTNMKYVGSSIKQDKENWIAHDCVPGDFYAYVTTPWKSFVDEFSFSVYGPSVTQIEQITQDQLPKDFFYSIFLEHARSDNSEKMTKLSTHETYYKRWDDQSGLGYLYFQNKDKSKIIDITVEMMNSINIKLCSPFQGFRPNFTLAPGKEEIIVYEPTKLPSSVEMRIISSEKQNTSNMKDFAKSEGTRLVRRFKGNDVGIYVYVVRTLDGVIYQYANTSKYYMLREEINFRLKDCIIEGTIGSYIEIVVRPGEEKLISIKKNKNSKSFSADLVNIDYDIRIV